MATLSQDISDHQRKQAFDSASLTAPGDQASRSVFARITAALALGSWATILMNFSVFPLFDATFPFARDISVTANALMMMIVGAIATFRPKALHVRALDVVTAFCLVVGTVLLSWALAFPGNAAVLTVSSSLFAIGRAGTIIMLGLAATMLSKKQIAFSVVMAFTACGAAAVITEFLPIWVGAMMFMLAPMASFVLVVQLAQPMLDLTAKSDAPADIAVTRPSTFLPLQNKLFVCIFLFSVMFGFSLRFGEPHSSAQMALIRLLPPLCIALYAISRQRFNADKLLGIAVVLIVTGFYMATYQSPQTFGLGSAIMSTGNTVFRIVLWFLLATLAAQNKEGALASFSWGFGTSSLGTLVGAALGMQGTKLAGDSVTVWIVFSGLMLAAFLTFVLVGMSSTNLQSSIERVTDPADENSVSTAPADRFETRCAQIAETAGLTPREAEVFQMLARGRDGTYIEKHLVISKSTVKAHVKHVYSKLGIHSHQELIDLVDNDQMPMHGGHDERAE